MSALSLRLTLLAACALPLCSACSAPAWNAQGAAAVNSPLAAVLAAEIAQGRGMTQSAWSAYMAAAKETGSGKAADMQSLGMELGFETVIVDAVCVEGEAVSSTRIREAVLKGDVQLAARMLGRPYSVSGTVTEGRHIGSSLGYATANLLFPSGKAVPGRGVYSAEVSLEDGVYAAAVNVGEHPTLPGGAACIEAHLLDYTGGALYGKRMKVSFLARLRDEQRFESREQLAARISEDIECVRRSAGRALRNLCPEH